MSDKITVSTFQFFEMFPDQETARKYLESRLWPGEIREKSEIIRRERAEGRTATEEGDAMRPLTITLPEEVLIS